MSRPLARPGADGPARHVLTLVVILAATAILVTWNLDREGISNPYYAAAVRSMLQDPVAMLFGGFDAGRYITLDKPPLGYQLQALAAAVLGFGGQALLLPQLVATVASVGVLYLLIRAASGTLAAILAAAVLALTPVAVAVARNTTVDATLVMVLLLAALALQQSVRTGRAHWLALSLALVGVGFELKMLQAYLVLPAFGAAWLAAAPGTIVTRVRRLALASVPLIIVSFAWPLVVQAWPADYRPWIGGSATNSLFELAIDYNGVARLATGPAWGDTGTAGPLRFLEPVLVGQVAWVLPLAVLGLALAAIDIRRGGRHLHNAPGEADGEWRTRVASLVLWATWLVTCLAFFSVARFWHRHYLVVLAPAMAALAGIGLALGWQAYRRPGAAGWLLPIAVLCTGVLASFTVAHGADLRWLAEPLLLASLAVGTSLGVARGAWRLDRRRHRDPDPTSHGTSAPPLAVPLVALAVVVVLVAPAAWSVWTVASKEPLDTALPVGGPAIVGIQPGLIDGGGGGGRVFDPRIDPALLDYLDDNRGNATWILGVEGGLQAAPLILETGRPVMAIGGFRGTDPAIGLDGFRYLVREGRLRFVSAGQKVSELSGEPGPLIPTAADVVLDWVVASCAPVTAFETLYDCEGRG